MINYNEIIFYIAIVTSIIVLAFIIYNAYKHHTIKPLVKIILLMAEVFADGIVTPEEWEILSQSLKKALEINYNKSIKEKEEKNSKKSIDDKYSLR